MWLVDCTEPLPRLSHQCRYLNGRMIKEQPRISHTIGAQSEAPGRTGEPNISAPDSAYAVQAAISRLAPVSHARSKLLVPPGGLFVMGTEHANILFGCLPKLRLHRIRNTSGVRHTFIVKRPFADLGSCAKQRLLLWSGRICAADRQTLRHRIGSAS